jgi:hypothetical protein
MIVKEKPNLNKETISLSVSLVNYLRNNEYDIAPSTIIDFFHILPTINIFNKDNLLYVTKSLFCSSKYTYDMYDNLFCKFLKKYEEDFLENQSQIERKRLNNSYNEEIKKLENDKNNINNAFNKKKEELLSSLDEKLVLKIYVNLSKDEKELVDDLLHFNEKLPSQVVDFFKNEQEKTTYKDKLEEKLLTNLNTINSDNVTNLLFKQLEKIDKVYNELSIANKEMDNKKKKFNEDHEQQVIKTEERKQEELTKIRIKYGTETHKELFSDKHMPVIDLLKEIDKKSIGNLSNTEYESLLYYIKMNAPKFRTKVSRSMKQAKNKQLDLKETVKNSMKLGGIPIKLCYKKPIVKKYKLVCILDISGSVNSYLGTLISFISELNSIFHGIEIYGFVNSLIDFTETFKEKPINAILETIIGFRGYSDYNKALNDYYENEFNKLDRNSIVIFFGDARNNKNPSAEKVIRSIKDRSRYCVWLNPEPIEEWDKGDSIIGKYSEIVNKVYEVNTVYQLIGFLNDFKLD